MSKKSFKNPFCFLAPQVQGKYVPNKSPLWPILVVYVLSIFGTSKIKERSFGWIFNAIDSILKNELVVLAERKQKCIVSVIFNLRISSLSINSPIISSHSISTLGGFTNFFTVNKFLSKLALYSLRMWFGVQIVPCNLNKQKLIFPTNYNCNCLVHSR